MKRERFERATLWIETSRDWNGRWFAAWKPHVSQGFRDPKAMLRWLSWPAKTPTGDELRAWLADLATADAKRESKTSDAGLDMDEVKATGFGPEAHLDESDPNYQTRTIT
jgi:hypothetical protein